MRLTASSKQPIDLAVFCRNHPEYLIRAEALSRVVTFRASQRWASAARRLQQDGPRPIYFAAIGEGQDIAYVAELVDLELDPTDADVRTRHLLDLCLEATKGEGLWDGRVKTLYAIRNCRSQHIPLARLVKISDGQPISPLFNYSYALVHAIEKL